MKTAGQNCTYVVLFCFVFFVPDNGGRIQTNVFKLKVVSQGLSKYIVTSLMSPMVQFQ